MTTKDVALALATLVEMFAGVPLSVGAAVEVTTTLKLLVAVRFAASETVQLTLVVPIAKVVPEAGVQTTVPGVLQPEATGAV